MIRSWCLMIFEYVWLACNRHRWCWCTLSAVHQYSRELEYVGIAISMSCYVRIIFQLLVSFNLCWMILWPSTSMFPSLFTPTLRFHLCEPGPVARWNRLQDYYQWKRRLFSRYPFPYLSHSRWCSRSYAWCDRTPDPWHRWVWQEGTGTCSQCGGRLRWPWSWPVHHPLHRHQADVLCHHWAQGKQRAGNPGGIFLQSGDRLKHYCRQTKVQTRRIFTGADCAHLHGNLGGGFK